MSELQASDVRDLFDYQDDGRLIWRIDTGKRHMVGAFAGTLNAVYGTYAVRIYGTRYMRARLAWAWHHGVWPEHRACHLNGNPSDDRIENLADLAHKEGRQLQRDVERTLPVGVAPARHGTRYTARCAGHHLGSFKSASEAHAAYEAAHRATYGDASRYGDRGVE